MTNAQPSKNAASASRDSLARLWPNRVHESNWLKNLACWLGLHRWHDMKFEGLPPANAARFCRWCSKSKAP
jgi:hypothetical protein